MHFVKKVSRWFLSFLFRSSIFSLAITASFLLVFGTPNHLKNTLKESKIYDNLINSEMDSVAKDVQDPEAAAFLKLPEVRAAANNAYPPRLLQSSAEQIIDSLYRWVSNKSADPDFNVNLTAANQKFAGAVGDYAVTRAKSLPPCTLVQLRQLEENGVDPFSATCLPRGFNLTALRAQITEAALGDKAQEGLLGLGNNLTAKNTAFKSDQNDPNSSTIFEDAKSAVAAYPWLKAGPFIFAAVAIFSGIGIFLLHDKKRRAIRNIGFTLTGGGVLLLIGTWFMSNLIKNANKPAGPLGKQLASNPMRDPLSHIVSSLSGAVAGKLYLFGAIYLVLGLGMLIFLRIRKPKEVSVPPEESAALPTPPSTPSITEVPNAQTPPREIPKTGRYGKKDW